MSTQLSPQDYYHFLRTQGCNFFAGVPDSLLKDFCACVKDRSSPENFRITANEGAAVGMAIGQYLVQSAGNDSDDKKKIPVVYLQNSGLGNTLNPLVSMADPLVYGIPMLLIIGWRGELGRNKEESGEQLRDEPQHRKQGRVTLSWLQASDIPYEILPCEKEAAEQATMRLIRLAKDEQRPVALVVRKDTFAGYTAAAPPSETTAKKILIPDLKREEAIGLILEKLPRGPVVSTTGMISRELFEQREKRKETHDKDFLVIGAMGHSAAIAQGLAMTLQKKNAHSPVYCFDGDGSVLMHMGSLAVGGLNDSPLHNFKHIVLNNGAHDSVGGQPTVALKLDMVAMAKSCGYRWAASCNNFTQLERLLPRLSRTEGPALLEVRVRKGARRNLGRPTLNPRQIKAQHQKYLAGLQGFFPQKSSADSEDNPEHPETLAGEESIREKRLLVDMSATILHHGHIRLLKKAREAGNKRGAIVVVGLTGDEAVLRTKGYLPELNFDERKEILLACHYVDKVEETPWTITEEILDRLGVDYLFHGEDNSNSVSKDRLITVPRTQGVSSSDLRQRSVGVVQSHINRRKIMLTPGPGSVSLENAFAVQPLFGRGDTDFEAIEERVSSRLQRLTGLPCMARLQGSASLALEIAARSFVFGRVLIVNTGYYCERLIGYCQTLEQLGRVSRIDIIEVDAFLEQEPEQLAVADSYDWLVSVYSETSSALLNDVPKLARLKQQIGAKLFLDATASIGLEEQHHLADLIAFSSCKGLAAMTGAAFICYQDDLEEQPESSFYLNVRTHLEKKMTGPYHQMAALDRLLPMQDEIRARVHRSKKAFMAKFITRVVLPAERQPLIGTRIQGLLEPSGESALYDVALPIAGTEPEIVFYQPRSIEPGYSVVCHFGELHLSSDQLSGIPRFLQLSS
ncbi:phosphonopyruvate decarboxylase [Candidatus Haliotispira prima]|uniref:Phosphonopyruvate decarboxylase n=1 Tax=Candidatus Haliotispira prima TaxID=3034016 RepID=A0ABY8MDX5_9SPIO|nr:phosphonopyruvate decarboxylase [Candidatus Haliotispira prima]